MEKLIIVPIKEANILRAQIRRLLKHRKDFLADTDPEALHDLRVASRRMREVLEYLQLSLPQKTQSSLFELGRNITRSLGKAREAEVNLKSMEALSKKRKLKPVAAEILIRKQTQRTVAAEKKARKRVAHKKFGQFEKFLSQLKGSLTLKSSDSPILLTRREEFLGFDWEGLNDERLHDLRIRTKKFRYSLEIYDRLHNRNLGHLLRRMKSLQDVLGVIHDLYVLEGLVKSEKDKWGRPNLTVIPMALQEALDTIAAEKARLYPRVNPLYSAIVERLPQHFALFSNFSLAPSA
jgi:CHAD domain-containing protein